MDCLREASSAENFTGIVQALAEVTVGYEYIPTLDGPRGFLPELPSALIRGRRFAHKPFISGDVLDEGTMFTPRSSSFTTADIRASIIAGYSPLSPGLCPSVLRDTAEILLDLYPDIPALGSPFGTGNNTFGLPPRLQTRGSSS